MTASIPDNTKTASPYQAGEARHLGAKRALGRALQSAGADGTRFQRVMDSLGRKLDPADKQSVHGAATLLVSQLFLAPLLAQARALPFGGDVGDGGRGEEVFGEQLDQRLADLVAGNLPGLTSQIESKLARNKGAVASDTPRSTYASWPAELNREGAN
jgi:hypothetical protein